MLFIGKLCFANMASPIREGTYGSSAFSSRDIDIIKERLLVTIDKDFKTAAYVIEYTIKTDSPGKQIPLLFHAKDYLGYFQVFVDGKETELKEIPQEYLSNRDSSFSKFEGAFEIQWNKYESDRCNLSDLKYFETDLTKGEHQIRVEYVARAWIDTHGWVNEYSFVYSLSPAKNWRSFAHLEITLNATSFGKPLTTNLGQPTSGKLETIAVWNFDALPANNFEITYQPKMSSITRTLIKIGPFRLTVTIGLIITLLHLIRIKQFRKKQPTGRSWVLLVGSIVNPFLIICSYMMSFSVIDYTIGPDAGGYHGYTFFIIFLYPIITPAYWILMWLADHLFKKKTSA